MTNASRDNVVKKDPYRYKRRQLQPSNRQYKVGWQDGSEEPERDMYSQMFYAQSYADDVGKKLDGKECVNHSDCCSYCCAKVSEQLSTKYCQMINIGKNPLTQEC